MGPEYSELIQYRTKATLLREPISKAQILHRIRRVFNPLQSSMLLEFETNPGVARSYFEQLKIDCQDVNIKPSRPAIAAAYVGALAGVMERISQEQWKYGCSEAFVFYFDVGYGLRMASRGIILAEEAISSGSDSVASTTLRDQVDIFEKIVGVDVPIDQQVERYLDTQLDVQRMVGILQKDPTGLALVDDCIRRVKSSMGNSFGFLVPEFVFAGANMGGKIYRAIYPLTDPGSGSE